MFKKDSRDEYSGCCNLFARVSHSGLVPKNPKNHKKIPALSDMISQKFQWILIFYNENAKDFFGP